MKILVTGGFGFIGSNLVEFLNKQGIVPHVLESENGIKQWKNVVGLKFELIRPEFIFNICGNSKMDFYDAVVHLGANVNTTEDMNKALWENNIDFSIKLYHYLVGKKTKFIYASSAAVYGAENNDFSERTDGLRPLNAYAYTKLFLDNYLKDRKAVGLRFFNVYGKNEGYKETMASVVHKGLNKQSPLEFRGWNHEIGDIYNWSLFSSTNPNVPNGEQKRDFVHVSDVCKVIWFFISNKTDNLNLYGVYNVGSGEARSFNDLANIVDNRYKIVYKPMPEALKSQYQYYTKADLTKLRRLGYDLSFLTLEEGVAQTKKDLGLT